MKKRITLYAILFVILAVSSAASELIYDDYMQSGETLTVNSNVLTVILASNNNQIWANFMGKDKYVDKTQCNMIENIRICFDSTQYDTDLKEYKAAVRVYKHLPTLAITRTASTSALSIGEEAVISVKIENTGNLTARDIYYEDTVPSELIVVSSTADRSGNQITWDGTITKQDEVTFTYTVRAATTMKKSSVAKVRYNNTITMKTVYSLPISYEVTSYLSFIQDIRPTELYPAKTFNYTINMTNSDDDSVDINALTIIFPTSVNITKKPTGMTKISTHEYKFTGDISANTTEEFAFELLSRIIGTYDILPSIEYSSEDIENLNPESITIANKGIGVQIEPVNNQELEEEIESRIKLYVQNKNPRSKIKNINIKTYTNITYISDVTLSEIDDSESVKAYDISFVAPYVKSTTTFPLSVQIDYETEYGEILSYEEKINIKVIKKADLVITQGVSSRSVEGGDEIIVSVTLTNNRQTDIDAITIGDSFPAYISVEGVTQKEISLDSGTEASVYIYKLTMPYVTYAQNFDINTSLSFIENGAVKRLSKVSTITINPKNYNLNFRKAISDSDVYIGEIVDVVYTLKNNDDTGIYNITFDFPKTQYADVHHPSITIPSLMAGEEVVQTLESVRYKFNKSAVLGQTTIFYYDENGILYNETTNEIRLTPSYTRVMGQLIFINRTYNYSSRVLNTSITNMGAEATAVVLVSEKVYTIDLSPFEKSTIIEKTDAPSNKEVSINYNYHNLDFTSYSNFVTYGVAPTTTTTSSTTSLETTTQDVATTESASTTEINDENKPGFWRSIIDRLKKVFTLFKKK